MLYPLELDREALFQMADDTAGNLADRDVAADFRAFLGADAGAG